MGSIPTLGTKPILQNVQAQEWFEQNRFTVVRWLRYSRDEVSTTIARYGARRQRRLEVARQGSTSGPQRTSWR